jgi:hypothetical protein
VKSTKCMLLGVVIMLLGLALVDSTLDGYLLRTFGVAALNNALTNIFPPVALGLIVVGVIIALIGLFLRDAARNPF